MAEAGANRDCWQSMGGLAQIALLGDLSLRMALSQAEANAANAEWRLREIDAPAAGALRICHLPSYRAETAAALQQAQRERTQALDGVAIWIERALRKGVFRLRGRPDLTAPYSRPLASSRCEGLTFDAPQVGAVTLGDGDFLFDCQLMRVRHSGEVHAEAAIGGKGGRKIVNAWLDAQATQGRRATLAEAELSLWQNGKPRVQRATVRAAFRERHPGLRPGRPRKS